MYTLRFTRPLLGLVTDPDEPLPAEVAPTTRLGDWYVVPLEATGRDLLLCTSERSRLSVVLPASDFEELPENLAIALVGVLHRLGLPKAVIAREIDAMTSGDVGVARDRALLTAMRTIGSRARTFIESAEDGIDVAALYEHLAQHPTRGAGGQTAAVVATALLMAPPAPSRPTPRARKTAAKVAAKKGASAPARTTPKRVAKTAAKTAAKAPAKRAQKKR
jgi:hypothetical protein